MVIWGAIWGGVLGLLWPGHDWEFQLFAGAILGALAGLMLRRAVRKEVLAQQAKAPAGAAAKASAPAAAATAAAAAAATPVATSLPATAMPAAAEAVPPATAAEPGQTAPPLATTTTPATPATPPAPVRPKPVPAPASPDMVTVLFEKARAWLFGGNTVVRMGVLVLFVGLAFLAKYAIENSLLPPELRLAAIGAAGIALFVVGFRLRGKSPDKLAYALTLQGAGVGVLYLTVFAAFRLYQFLPAGAAFAALGLVCAFSTVIALAQNAPAMAFIGFAGGFAAPILVSTGQGNHVGLFSYYLLLSVAIAIIAWAKAWRALNLLGFFATFGVATLWGALKYQPELFSSTEPFLIGFFLVYVAASVLYATRHSLSAKKAVDGTLVFGVPIVAFSLQAGLVRSIEYATAFSSLALGAFYLVLGLWMARRKQGRDEASRWMAECFAALGLGFVTLAVPLALDARWTSAVWAIEGAGVYWLGRRQGRWLARAAGLALQGFAAISFLSSTGSIHAAAWPLANPVFIGAVMLAVAALGIAWWTRMPLEPSDSALARGFAKLENTLAPVLFWVGFLWWQFALNSEIFRHTMDANGVFTPVFKEATQIHLRLLAWTASAFAFHFLASPKLARPWAIAATPAWAVLPLLLMGAIYGATSMNHVFEAGGWVVWPVLLALHFVMLRRLDSGTPAGWWPWVHAGGVWLLVFLAGNLLVFAIGRGSLWQTAWATVILLVAGTVVLMILSRRAWFETGQKRWPLDRFARAYLWLASAPLAVGVALGSLLVAVYSDGNARPLPYVPLLNPTDLAVAMGLAACTLWLVRLRGSALDVPKGARASHWLLVLAGLAFVAINTVWLRVAHHFFAVPWDAGRLFDSFLVQAGYSILWTLLALGLMVGAHRRGLRNAWMLGAVLLGATVLKLFVIDLSNRGGSERIFVFIAVGILMLVVGYFAPLPPPRAAVPAADDALEGARP
ncbi:DUF2339 domain-containing protein [Ramlibacter sp. WS9]|uniref:DUF2339 domain-containing protein n=1 Tax=Ramlibacter sp. WS9 TaxID=1882741 RepID=UPI001142BED5|nr:DUF2339 domain-containing protein [Ramlibacter sp. WS9]ROZ76136.1 DUF2339 domain-containing protein [Ramlibacter sp. WS9]